MKSNKLDVVKHITYYFLVAFNHHYLLFAIRMTEESTKFDS